MATIRETILKILIKNETKGLKELRQAARNYASVNKNVKSASNSLAFFKRAFQTVIAGAGIRELARAADQFQLIQDRIRIFSESGEEAKATFDSLVQSARFTRTSVSALGESFNRIALATKELGLSNEAVIASTVALQQTFRISGSTIAEATAATIQLSQGLSSGQLRGQELRSVLEQNAVFAGLLAEELGTTRGQLIKFAESGKITSDRVLRVLADNFDSLNEQASKLGTTFEQAVTVGLDAFRVKIAELNKEFGISSKFTTGILFLIDNLELFASVIGGIVLGGILDKMLAGLVDLAFGTLSLGAALKSLTRSFVFFLAAEGIIKLIVNWEEATLRLSKIVINLEIDFVNFFSTVLENSDGLRITLLLLSKAVLGVSLDFKLLAKDSLEIANNRLVEIEKQLLKFNKKDKPVDSVTAALARMKKELELAAAGFKGVSNAQDSLATLNFQVKSGAISLQDYNLAIENIKRSEIEKNFEEGKIGLEEYNNQLSKLTQGMDNLDKIALGLGRGLSSVAKEAGDITGQVASATRSTFSTLEDAIVDFTKNGKFAFKDFAESVLEDLQRIIIRATIISPLAQSLANSVFTDPASSGPQGIGGGQFGPNIQSANANGNAFNSGNVLAFQNGGVVNRTTAFGLSGGRTGIMGEAGPEAILPLRRGSNGKLGVEASGNNVQVNIINQTDSGVESRESNGPNGERILDIIIGNKVKDTLASGAADGILNEAFGLRRRGR